MIAGFQNIDDSAPPAATPANDEPCPAALCSRRAKPPAFASAAAANKTAALVQANKYDFTPRYDMAFHPTTAPLFKLALKQAPSCRVISGGAMYRSG